ncbi:MAG: hypothetical protein EBY19_05725 [Burkholderiaceae bacterium]|nr:hypothetical protein [Burkholderiaceae bacterium]
MVADYVQTQPVLIQISAAKQLRDRVERDTETAGEKRVTAERVRISCPEILYVSEANPKELAKT